MYKVATEEYCWFHRMNVHVSVIGFGGKHNEVVRNEFWSPAAGCLFKDLK